MLMRLHIAVATLAVVWLGIGPLEAQKKPPANPPAPHPAGKAGKPPNSNQPKENPVEQLERFQKMSPEERDKALAKLPPERRERVEQQLQRFDKMKPEQREQQMARLKAFQKLSPQRRQIVRQEIDDIRSLPPRLRAARLNGVEMKSFSPDEQQLIRDNFPGITRNQKAVP
jgi:hypothetical protein